MAFGKRTDDVIGSVPNKPKLTKYIMMSSGTTNNISDEEKIITKLKFKKDDLFNDFENDEDINFLYFEDKDFIPINDNYSKLEKIFLNSTKEISVEISNMFHDSDDFLFTTLTKSELNHCLNNINSLNLYLTIGFFEFDGFSAPLFYVPIKINDNHIQRDYNKDIKFNYFLKAEIEDSYDITFPEINLNVEQYLNTLEKFDGFKISNNKSFVGNFYFRKLLIYEDLSMDHWNSYEKFNSFFNNNYIYSIEEFKNLNNNIANNWPELDLKYTKDLKMKGADKLIVNLLSQGNSILYVSNYYSKNEVKKSLKNMHLNPLILDFDYSLSKYSLFDEIDNDSFIFDETKDISYLAEKKFYNKNMFNILKDNYLNFNLTPFEIQQKRDEFSQYNFEINLDVDGLSLDEVDNINQAISDISNNLNLINILKNCSDDVVFTNSDYENFNEILKSVYKNITKFELFNNNLNKKYNLSLFNDLMSPQFLENLNYLSESSKYIDREDYNKLNEFIKIYYEYQNLKNDRSKVFPQKIDNYVDNLLDNKEMIETFNDKIDEINSLAEYCDISENSFEDQITYLSLLLNHPVIVEDEYKLKNILNTIEEYKNEKNFEESLTEKLKNFWEDNKIINTILNDYQIFLKNNSERLVLYNVIKNLVNLFSDSGFNFTTLNDYFNIKNELVLFENAEYIENQDYFKLNKLLKEFLKTHDESLNNYLNDINLKLGDIFNKIKDIFCNRYSATYKKDLFNNINEILKVQGDLGFKFNNFEELVENEDFIKYLNNSPNFNPNFEDEYLVGNFEKINKFNISTTVQDYINSLINDYITVLKGVNNLAEEYLKNNYKFEYIKQNILDIITIKDKLGVNLNSLNKFKDKEYVLDILTQSPQLNYNTEEYELYLDINRICQDYDIYDIEKLLKFLNNDYFECRKLIDNEIEPILNSQYDLNFIEDKINEILGIIDNLSYLINCNKINKFNEIDDFISNIQTLKNKPIFIENYEEFDSYIETIDFLNNTNILDEQYLNECNIKLEELNDLDSEIKLKELGNIIEICYNNDTSIFLLDLKKDYLNLMENVEKLNINLDVLSLDLDKCIESLKPEYYIVDDNNSKNKDSKMKISLFSNEKTQYKYKNTILNDFEHSKPEFESKKIISKSKNFYLNKESINNILFNNFNNNPVSKYLKKNYVSNNDIIGDLELLKEYYDKFNGIYVRIYEYVYSNLEIIREFTIKQDLYYNNIEGILKTTCPNSFNGIESNITDLKKEFQNNKSFTQLVESGFFNDNSYHDFPFDEVNKKILELKKSKNDLIKFCSNSDFNLDDTFDNILIYIENLLNEINIFKKESYDSLFSLNYLNEYISDELLYRFDNSNNKILKLSNLSDDFINNYFKNDYGLKIKENIKLIDKFNNLIKNNVFTDKTISYLEDNSQSSIEEDVTQLKININSVCSDLSKKGFNLDNSFNMLLDEIESIRDDNLRFKQEIDEISYLLDFVDFTNYNEYNNQFIRFIEKYQSKLNLNKCYILFKQILSKLDVLNEVHVNDNYKNDFLNFTKNQVYDELLKLRNNLTYNKLVNMGFITDIPPDTNDLISLIDETKNLISENDYTVSFDELIEDNTNTITLLKNFDEKWAVLLKEFSNKNIDICKFISDFESIFNEYSIPLTDEYLSIKEDILFNFDLINLCVSLDFNLLNLSKNELIDYIHVMNLNESFSNYIISNKFSKEVCNFYQQNDFISKLEKMENLSLEICNSIDEQDFNKDLLDIVEVDLNSLFIDFSEINKLKENNFGDSKGFIDNNLLILDKICNLSEYKIAIRNYHSEILKVKENLDYLIRLNDFEVEIKKNENLIEKHFSEILNSKSFSVRDLYEKLEIDLEFTNYYNEGVFSDKTIENMNYLHNIDLSLNKYVPKLFDSKDYLNIYKDNKSLIKEITNFENGVTNKLEFLINTNEILNDVDINDILNRDIDNQITDYESCLSSFTDIYDKYFDDVEDVFHELRNHIAYTELVDNGLFEDKNLIKSEVITNYVEINELNSIYYSLLNDIYKISDFYKKFDCFELNQNSFNYELTFEKLKNNLKIFENDLNDLYELNNISQIIISLTHKISERNIDFDMMYGIFNYNVYNSILNNFYNDFPDIKGNNLDSNKYKKELKKIDKQINKNIFNQILTEIYAGLHEEMDEELISNQKDSLNQKLINNALGTVKETLNEFKEYIINVKPIFMMDMDQFYEYISNEYESSFDYVIIDKNFKFEELDHLSLFLRSKNKLIDLR